MLRPSRSVALVTAGVVVGAAGAGAAIAIGSVGSGGVIYACVATSNGEPSTNTGNIRIIDPSAGQACNPAVGAGTPEQEITWNQTGPQGPAGNVITLAGGTFTISGVKQVATLENVSPVAAQESTGTHAIATLAVGSGKSGQSFSLTGWSVIQPGGTSKATHGSVQIQRVMDKSSPTLFKWCTTGKHINDAKITIRKAIAGKHLTMNLTNVTISAYDESTSSKEKPTETLTLNYTKIEYSYSHD
jgi:type VI protein secretion system component Hcp